MFKIAVLRRAYAVISRVELKCLLPPAQPQPKIKHIQFRALNQPPEGGKSRPALLLRDADLPNVPPLSSEDEGFLKELAGADVGEFGNDTSALDGEADASELPEAPDSLSSVAGFDIDEEAEEEAVEDIDPIPYFPPVQKIVGSLEANPLLNVSQERESIIREKGVSPVSQSSESELDLPSVSFPGLKIAPYLEPALDAWLRAVAPTPATRPMPLHELANRSIKIKELVKLGVDFSKIAERHGDLERLLHLDWQSQIKSHIRFLVDCGIQPDRLGAFFSRNTQLLWTDKDDIQVRLNYLEAKRFTKDQILAIINKAPFWLTLSTKELDSRLGFIQKTFKLQGSSVRYIASSFPTIVSSKRWSIFVDTTKLMDREFGFREGQRTKLLFASPQCFLRPTKMRKAFDLCHNEIGLSHTQLVRHATLLVNRVNRMKPRYDFLRFLKRDVFDIRDPLYLSPDWLWKGTVQEFCEQAAKTSVEEYEYFLKHSML